MSNYSPLVDFKTEFEGDKVSMKLDQLTRDVFLGWIPFMDLMDEEGKLDEVQTLKLVNEAAGVIPKFVQDFKGLKDADGNAIALQTVVEKVYFIELVTKIVMQLIQISQIGRSVEEKAEVGGKSEGPLQEPLPE